jgi:hypothetical protein
MVADSRKPQTLRIANEKVGRRLRLGAREQSNPVPLPNKLLRQSGHNPLRSAIELGRHGFRQRRDEGDTH